MKNNKFIIIMPSYNVAKWVGLSLETLKNQSYKNFECVIGDLDKSRLQIDFNSINLNESTV